MPVDYATDKNLQKFIDDLIGDETKSALSSLRTEGASFVGVFALRTDSKGEEVKCPEPVALKRVTGPFQAFVNKGNAEQPSQYIVIVDILAWKENTPKTMEIMLHGLLSPMKAETVNGRIKITEYPLMTVNQWNVKQYGVQHDPQATALHELCIGDVATAAVRAVLEKSPSAKSGPNFASGAKDENADGEAPGEE